MQASSSFRALRTCAVASSVLRGTFTESYRAGRDGLMKLDLTGQGSYAGSNLSSGSLCSRTVHASL